MKITFAQWMKDTAAIGRPRSKELKAVDEAFEKYELALENSTGSVLTERRALKSALGVLIWLSGCRNSPRHWDHVRMSSSDRAKFSKGAIPNAPTNCLALLVFS